MKRLGLARVGLGALFIVRTTCLVNGLPIPLAHVNGILLGWPEPGWPMAWGGLVLPESVRMVACLVRTAAAALFVLGVHARTAGVVAAVLGLVALSQDPFGFVFTLYTLFLGTIILALTDATSLLALRPDPRLDPRSSVQLLAFVVATIYAFSGLAKAHAAWLNGATLLALAQDGLLTPAVTTLLRDHAELRVGAAWATMASELGLAIALLFTRSRRIAVAIGLALHAGFQIVAHPDVMGLVMAALLVGCAHRDEASSRRPVTRS